MPYNFLFIKIYFHIIYMNIVKLFSNKIRVKKSKKAKNSAVKALFLQNLIIEFYL